MSNTIIQITVVLYNLIVPEKITTPSSLDVHPLVKTIFRCVAGKPLFPGTSTLDQIERIMTIIPTPSRQGKLRNLNNIN